MTNSLSDVSGHFVKPAKHRVRRIGHFATLTKSAKQLYPSLCHAGKEHSPCAGNYFQTVKDQETSLSILRQLFLPCQCSLTHVHYIYVSARLPDFRDRLIVHKGQPIIETDKKKETLSQSPLFQFSIGISFFKVKRLFSG